MMHWLPDALPNSCLWLSASIALFFSSLGDVHLHCTAQYASCFIRLMHFACIVHWWCKYCLSIGICSTSTACINSIKLHYSMCMLHYSISSMHDMFICLCLCRHSSVFFFFFNFCFMNNTSIVYVLVSALLRFVIFLLYCLNSNVFFNFELK